MLGVLRLNPPFPFFCRAEFSEFFRIDRTGFMRVQGRSSTQAQYVRASQLTIHKKDPRNESDARLSLSPWLADPWCDHPPFGSTSPSPAGSGCKLSAAVQQVNTPVVATEMPAPPRTLPCRIAQRCTASHVSYFYKARQGCHGVLGRATAAMQPTFGQYCLPILPPPKVDKAPKTLFFL